MLRTYSATLPHQDWLLTFLKSFARNAELYGGGARGTGFYCDRQDGRFGLTGDFYGGMEKFGEGFDARDQARSGPRKIAVGFQAVDAAVSNGRNGVPRLGERHRLVLLAGPLGAVPARRNEQDIRRRVYHIFDGDSKRWRAGAAKDVLASSALNHFRNPVASDIERLQPFEKSHARAIRKLRQLPLQRPEACADLLYHRFRLGTAAC